MLIFAVGTMGYFFVKNKIWETIALIAIAMVLFRPGLLLDRFQAPYLDVEPTKIFEIAKNSPDNSDIRLQLEGFNLDGELISSTYQLPLGKSGGGGFDRLTQYTGIEFIENAENKIIVDSIAFGGAAGSAGIDFDWELKKIKVPSNRLPKEIFYIPAFLALGLIIVLQRRRSKKHLVS